MNSSKSGVVTFMIHHMPTLNAPTPPHSQPQHTPYMETISSPLSLIKKQNKTK